jgi:hypothetical protein
MNDETKKQSWLQANGARLIMSAIVFGVLMELRAEMHSIWLRMLVAAVAGGVLGVLLLRVKKTGN